ncbi:oligosaccharide flippase family protein [Arsenicicoccus dermatophilus]|uniref:oligosaccharide flippase family protein n=1 Tax=Arsenicicoccus dermatophilus TaxID=1076331 RepID=UPI001F4CCBEC|nr:oligosaccharide flippase family protein [Arsenicicoccus dermatophilus]MCH8614026.1 oligosaccharide flippase family protein [Arsenicicoccus dermatophilus]
MRARRAVPAGAVLFAGTFAGALLGYAFFVVLGRVLPPADLGAVGSLVNLSTILTVPGVGLQLVTARRVAGGAAAGARPLLGAALLLGGGPALLLAGCAWLVAPALHLDSPWPVLVLASSAVPLTLTSAAIGLLQGREAFGAVGLLALLTGVVKVLAALVTASLGQGVLGVTCWYAGGWVLLALAGAALVRRTRAGDGETLPAYDRTWTDGIARAREALAASAPTAGLLVLSSLDVLLARHHLADGRSGTYTMGALLEKVAFWGPQFLATLYYPRMARPAERPAALRAALGLTAGVGAIGVALAAGLGDLLVRVVGGARFVGELAPLAWAFTALGVLLALVQVLVYADLAVHGRRVGAAVWVTVVAAVAAVAWWHASVAAVVLAVLACVAVLVVVALVLVRRSPGPSPAPRAP